jgi:hypothetical protein
MSGRAELSAAAVAPNRSRCAGNMGIRPARCFAWAVAGLLVTSASLKAAASMQAAAGAREFATGEITNPSVILLLVVCVIEYTLAAWLTSGRRQQGAWLACTFVFSAFLPVSAHAASIGVASCGCFGRVPVPPCVASLFDGAVLVGFFAIWSDRDGARPQRKLTYLRKWLIFFSSGAVCGGLVTLSPAFSMTQVISSTEGHMVVLEPRRWLGQVMPLLQDIDIGSRLKTGKWQLILVRHTCPICRNLVDELLQGVGSLDRTPIAIIDVEPMTLGPSAATAVPGCILGRLSERATWFVETPTVIVIEDAIVKKVSHSLRGEDP